MGMVVYDRLYASERMYDRRDFSSDEIEIPGLFFGLLRELAVKCFQDFIAVGFQKEPYVVKRTGIDFLELSGQRG